MLARAGLDFDFYLATKHWCVHYMHAELGLPPRVIAEQMGWTLAGVLKLLAVYGHGDVGALEESTGPSSERHRASGGGLGHNSDAEGPVWRFVEAS